MADRASDKFQSGDAMVVIDADLAIVSWNPAAEALTGISGDEALGRQCWDVLCGRDERGGRVCHSGCATGRLAREGRAVSRQCLLVNARQGKRAVEVSTVAVDDGDGPLFLHLMVPRSTAPPRSARPALTPRQQEVLGLLADGAPAKVIAARLGLAEITVRNHIRAVLTAFGSHSQLEAVAKARLLRYLD